MRYDRFRRTGPLAAALLAAATLAACGSSEPGDTTTRAAGTVTTAPPKDGGGSILDPTAAVAQAAERTAGIEGMRVSVDETIDGTHITGSGFISADGERGKFLIEAEGESVIVVNDGFTMYMQPTGSGADDLPNGKRWVKIDLQKAGEGQGYDLEALQSVGPDQQKNGLDQLRSVTDVKEVGSEDVRGVSTTHYRGSLDLDTVGDTLPADRRATVKKSIAVLLKELPAGDHTLPVDVWVDAEGRIRRYSQTIDSKVGKIEMSQDLYDFGVSEEVPIPSGDDVYDVTDDAIDAAKKPTATAATVTAPRSIRPD